MKAITIRGLKKTYKGGVTALKGIDLDIEEGEFYALLGPNGAGKTTTIGVLTGLVIKSSGKVTVMGIDLDEDPYGVRRLLGVVPQEFNFNIFDTVFDIVVRQAGYYGVPRAEAKKRAETYLKELGLWEKRNTKARYLSGGMKRRLLIARGLVHEPKILILDEPTAGVDVELRRSMWSFLERLNSEGTTIILTTHYIDEAEHLASHIGILNEGRMLESSPKRQLLQKLHAQHLVLTLAEPLEKLPAWKGYTFDLQDETTLEVVIPADKDLNTFFSRLKKKGIQVESLRTKTGRLEELFMEMVGR